jgi:Holliday junction DNA helicase RuvB
MDRSFIESSLEKETSRPSLARDKVQQGDEALELSLRPQSLAEFTGQNAVRERLEVMIGAAKLRSDPLGHCLFSGPPGLGKTTLANILAKAMGTNIVVTSGAVIEKPGDLAGILTHLKTGDILFIDELHRLNRTAEEYLYPAMEDFILDIMLDSGPSARSVQVKLNQFTLVGATTRTGLLSGPLRSRFLFTCRLNYYEPELIAKILERNGKILNIQIDPEAALEIARRARGTPRIAINLLKWARDYAQMHSSSQIDIQVADKALNMLAIDSIGLDEMDKRILQVMRDHYKGGPVGVNSIAIAVGEERETIEEVYEPYLIMQGFLKRTPRGRELTDLAYTHMDRMENRICG